MVDILEQIEKTLTPGVRIPKPETTNDFLVKGWGSRRGVRALIYTIPNHKTPTKPHEKGITTTEWRQAFSCLSVTGELSRSWFNQAMLGCAKEGPCNFTTIGGVFQLLGYATHERGLYRSTKA